jgi:translation initiation factor IF-2
MAERLVKIAKELNVGLATIVDFLASKGHIIENKPTSHGL